jgi:nitrate/nitrite transporter NarK
VGWPYVSFILSAMPNFGLFNVHILCTVFTQLMPRFMTVYHWSAILAAVHFIPVGVLPMFIASFTNELVKYVNPKWIILGGLILDIIATVLLPFADRSSRYWSFLFPAFLIGTLGNFVVYAIANMAFFMVYVLHNPNSPSQY